jgi:hypothetical protein
MRLRLVSVTIAISLMASDAQAATFTVTTTQDNAPGSLRDAVQLANTSGGVDVIMIATSGTVTLLSPLPPITESATITGPGTDLLTISGNNTVRIFRLAAGTTNSISGLTIANGMATNYENGAGIENLGNLTVSNCVVAGNQNFGGWGGGVFSAGTLRIIDSTFQGNHVTGEKGSDMSRDTAGSGGAAGMGGALFSMSGKVSIVGSTFIANSARGGDGGAVDCCVLTGTGCGGGVNRSCACGTAGFGSGGAGAFNPECRGGNGGFGGGGGGGVGPFPPGVSEFGGGAGGGFMSDYNSGGGGAGIGGAIFVDSGMVTIVDCTFAANSAIGGTGGFGGTKWIDPVYNAARTGGNGGSVGPDFFTRAGIVWPTLTTTLIGGGRTSTDPANGPYLSNSWANVTATPELGWKFLHWLGDASGTNDTIGVKVTRDKHIQAVFGTTITNAALISSYPESDLYPYGTFVKLTALPPLGTYFISWTGDGTGTRNPLSFTVTFPNRTFSFQLGALEPAQFALTVIERGKGSVQINPPGNRFNSGDQLTLTPIPDQEQEFIRWNGDATGTQNPLSVTMDRSKVITANFTTRPTLRVSTPLEGLNEEGFRLTILGEFGTAYSVLGSTNLLDWHPVGTVSNTYGTVQLNDPDATNLNWRAYKALTQ